ncbi:hypothetical protein DDB_G0271578 [Dictyostelium discoideum AX4]|uniref:Uncharacterized protein n=1 Tax=Dictyostelium discoideum TaxID=44689 RepID=Q55AU7_DICDI|nr:hypothetical protein DDB_G0271578 [Dictyostelium discoideum AX4]EAL71653.1 hypothetical protein DDB_G0271578 [Dictyostelium discoideum AX4]|eukprot:XP_645599.1 hypothetical protein DDB_G0271578 [Dictyostelium discoideum AX4]
MAIFENIIKFLNKNNKINMENTIYSNPNDKYNNNFNNNNNIQKWKMPTIIFLGPVQVPAYI